MILPGQLLSRLLLGRQYGGAGDCFGGTLISCLAQGIDLERTLTLANAAGALAVTKRGPMEGNTTLSELEPFVASAERTP